MAIFNGEFNLGGDGYSIRLTVTEASYNVGDNTSLVDYLLQAVPINASQHSSGDKSSGFPWNVVINGSTVANGTPRTYDWPLGGSTVTIASGQTTVVHNPDGSKNINVSAHVEKWYSTATNKAADTSGNLDLTKIPRASQPSLDVGTKDFGGTFTINTNRATSSFTHVLSYVFGSVSGQIATGVGDSTTWPVPTALASQIPAAENGTGTITCDTYNGAELIGTKTVAFTLTVPAAWIPALTQAHTNFSATNPSNILNGYFIQGISTLSLLLAAGLDSLVSAYGTQIEQYQVWFDTYNSGVQSYTNSSAITALAGLIGVSGAQLAHYRVKDKRGRWSAEVTETVQGTGSTIWPYSTPADAGWNVYRDATVFTKADYLMKFTARAIGGANTWTYQRQRYVLGAWSNVDASPVAISVTAVNDIYNFTATLTDDVYTPTGYAENLVYDLRVKLVDKFSTVYFVDTMPTSDVPLSLTQYGAGIGKIPTNGGLYDLEVGAGGLISDGVIKGTFQTGSSTMVPNLNAEKVGGKLAADFLLASGYTAADILAKIKTVDGTGSGLDADFLRGMSPESNSVVNSVVSRDGSGNIRGTTFIGDRYQSYYAEFGMNNNTWTPAVWLPTNGARPCTYLVCAGLAAVQDSDNWSICAIITVDATHGKIIIPGVSNSLTQLRCVASALQLIQQSGGAQIGFVSYTRIL